MRRANVAMQGRASERGVSTFLPEPTPTPLWIPLISTDDHCLEPADLFEQRVSTAFKDRVPRSVVDEDGVPYWVFNNTDVMFQMYSVMDAAVGRPVSEWGVQAQKLEELRRGTWDPRARLIDMDMNGVWASLCFPSSVWGFAGRRISRLKDKEAALVALRAYNDWMFEEWVGAAPDRYIACQIPWLNDPEVAGDEIRRNAARGFKSVTFIENPEPLGYPSIHTGHWDPFFRACEETDTVVNLHVGSSGKVHCPSSDSPGDVRVALLPVNGITTVVDWIYSRVPLRFPNLKVALTEAGVSWVPMVIERLNRAWRQVDASSVWNSTDPDPVSVLKRNFRFTSIEDPSAMRALDIIGDHTVVLEVDYPHADSSWPTTQDLIRNDLARMHRAAR